MTVADTFTSPALHDLAMHQGPLRSKYLIAGVDLSIFESETVKFKIQRPDPLRWLYEPIEFKGRTLRWSALDAQDRKHASEDLERMSLS